MNVYPFEAVPQARRARRCSGRAEDFRGGYARTRPAQKKVGKADAHRLRMIGCVTTGGNSID